MRRILLDFTLTAEDAQARLRRQIPDLTAAEFAAWDAAGLFERQTIDGRTLYFNRAPSNLFRLSADALKRRRFCHSAVDRWTQWRRPTRITARCATRRWPAASHAAAPRRVQVTLLADRESGRGAGRRDAARLAAVSARAPGTAGEHSAPRKHARATHASRRSRRCNARSTWSSAPARQADEFFDHLRADRLRPVPRDRCREGACPRRAPASSRRIVAERPPHIVFTPAIREFSREIVGDGNESVPHRAEAVRRGRSHPVGRRARIFHDLQHQRLRAARRSRRLRPADAAADDAAAPERHSGAVAVRLGLLRRRIRQHARLGAGLSGAAMAGCPWT